jgi:class 3 adenylate cyclase/tetratricopeptide (TPR) repeat protein
MLARVTDSKCARCGAPLPAGARFCPNCGAPVAAPVTEERKVVSVVFADIVGSTRLAAQLDPERFREVIAAFYRSVSDVLASLRGRAEKFVGDAAMAVFGVPQIHEDDAVRAVRAAIRIRDRVSRLGDELRLPLPLRVRVGVNTGPVATGFGPADQLLVSGATVNVAARLQQAADPHEILAGETTWQLTRHAVEFGPVRVIEARGIEGELEAWPVLALSTRSARRTIPLVGRKRELALLRETFERVRETSRPHLVTILGERGIGKRRLVQELVSGLPEGTSVLTGRASEFEEDVTLAPISEMIRRELGVQRTTPADEVRERLEEVIAGCCDPSETDRTVARLGLVVGLGEDEREERRYRAAEIRAGFLAFVDGKARDGPVVLVFEELHLAQPALFELIEHVLRQARRVPVLVLSLAREELLELRPEWGGGLPDSVTLRLEPLAPQEARELALAAGESLDGATAERIAAHAGGNPFFIVETTGMLLQSHDEHVEGVAHSHLLPPTVQAVVASRIDHLSPDGRELIRRASVFPRSTFHVDELALIAEPKEDVLRELEDAELIVRDPEREGAWRFRHGVFRDVAYDSLPKRERLRLHLLIADSLAADREDRKPQAVAYHLERAAAASLDLDPSDRSQADRAVDALAEAGHQTRRRIQSRRAIELYERALELAGPENEWGEREARILSGTGESWYWLGEYEAAGASLRRALETAGGDPWTRTHAMRFLGDIELNVHGSPERARELFDQALAAARELDDPWPIARTLLLAGWAPYWQGDLQAARRMFEDALAAARSNPDGDLWAEARALTSLASVISPVGDEVECLRLAEEALELGRRMDDAFTIAVARGYAGNSLRRMWRLDEALPLVEESLGTFLELDAKWELADALDSRGTIHRLSGRLAAAEGDLREALRICSELRERSLITWTTGNLTRVLLERGELAEAKRVFETLLRARGREELGTRASVLFTRSLIALSEGDLEAARGRAVEALEEERVSGQRNAVAASVWWVGTLFGPEAVGGGAMEEARRTLEAAHWIQALREPDITTRRLRKPAEISAG